MKTENNTSTSSSGTLDANFKNLLNSETVAQRCSVKQVFKEMLQNSQENTCARVSFVIKLQAGLKKLLRPAY